MHSDARTEHFVTLFDRRFIPIGLCLYASLKAHARPFRLWVIALDEEAEKALLSLSLPDLSVVPLRDIETPELLNVKKTRSLIEYFWTLSPFTFQAVFDRDPAAARVTYLDADLYFFNAPAVLLQELDKTGKPVLITEHAYDPRYDQTADSGKFCVQFITVTRNEGGLKVMQWWQARCLEWCYNRVEDGKFGDQRYLDQWPLLFGREVHVLDQKSLALAPWNADYYASKDGRPPVFFHFHGLRIASARRIRLSTDYRIGKKALAWYKAYALGLSVQMALLEKRGIGFAFIDPEPGSTGFLTVRRLKRIFRRKTEHWAFRLFSGRWTLVT